MNNMSHSNYYIPVVNPLTWLLGHTGFVQFLPPSLVRLPSRQLHRSRCKRSVLIPAASSPGCLSSPNLQRSDSSTM